MNNQYKQTNTSKSGFTIIEVVLVLAIAGLIFLMVFLALPALQRGQRDTERKNALSRINTQISNYQSSNRGAIPTEAKLTTTGTGFVARYLGGSDSQAGSEYVDPTTGEGYTFVYGADDANPGEGQILYRTGTICDDDGATTTGSGRQYTLRMMLENQPNAPYCIDNR